jgi:hypothetical protein
MPLVDSAEGKKLQLTIQALKLLQSMPVGDAIGAACSFLFQCAQYHRPEFRRVMNERIVREGFNGLSLLDVFKRFSQ